MKKKFVITGIFFALFITLMILVLRVDVSDIGPNKTSIGLSTINGGFRDFFGYNEILCDITGYLGYISLIVAALFCLVGLVQLIKRKSLFKVDKKLLCLGGLYVFVGFVYVLFEKVVINYRPVLESGQTSPEASFPSSHTLLAFVIMGSTMVILKDYVSNKVLRSFLNALCAVIIVATVVGRAICGIHWLTDIVASVLLSVSVIALFSAACDEVDNEEKNKE